MTAKPDFWRGTEGLHFSHSRTAETGLTANFTQATSVCNPKSSLMKIYGKFSSSVNEYP